MNDSKEINGIGKNISDYIKLKVSNDKMTAFLNIFPDPNIKKISYQDVINILGNNKIIFGIDNEVIKKVCANPIYNKDLIVAKGKSPTKGENGKIKYYFDINKHFNPKILEDGTVDFHELDLVKNVHKGNVLAEIIPPTEGIEGKNVYGEKILAVSGKPATLVKGKNISVSEDGLKYAAVIDGQVTIVDRKINVYPVYEVKGNVDNSTGDVKFVGNVVVKGNVLTGFQIQAGGTVEVYGVVEGAKIIADGDIILHRGMQGMEKGELISKNGNIISKYIENSNLLAKGNIKCEAIMHSIVKCDGILELEGKKGLFVGGGAKVGKEIIAKTIGSPMSTLTQLEVGLDPQIRDKYKELKDKIYNVSSDIKKTNQAIKLLTKLEKIKKLSAEKKSMLDKFVKTRVFLNNKLSEVKEQYLEIENKLENINNGKIRASNLIYPGTKVTIGTSLKYIRESLKYVKLYCDNEEIKIGEYSD